MVAHVATVAFLGLEARAVEVQVQISSGLPKFLIVGLPDKAVAESRERVHAALAAIGLSLPPKRITVNLSPADLPKEGGRFDLPIAIGILLASEQLPGKLSECELYGELSLSGDLRAVKGALLAAVFAGRSGHSIIVPPMNAVEARLVSDCPVGIASNLLEVAAHITEQRGLECGGFGGG